MNDYLRFILFTLMMVFCICFVEFLLILFFTTMYYSIYPIDYYPVIIYRFRFTVLPVILAAMGLASLFLIFTRKENKYLPFAFLVNTAGLFIFFMIIVIQTGRQW